MATLTASTAVAGYPVKADIGENSVSVRYNSGSTVISASATTILLLKIPNKCTITNIVANHSIGSATCPVDYGIQGSLSAFASAVTIGAIALTAGVLPYDVSVSDSAAQQFVYITATATPGTSTTSFVCNMTVFYRMD